MCRLSEEIAVKNSGTATSRMGKRATCSRFQLPDFLFTAERCEALLSQRLTIDWQMAPVLKWAAVWRAKLSWSSSGGSDASLTGTAWSFLGTECEESLLLAQVQLVAWWRESGFFALTRTGYRVLGCCWVVVLDGVARVQELLEFDSTYHYGAPILNS